MKELLVKVSLPSGCKGFKVKFILDHGRETMFFGMAILPPQDTNEEVLTSTICISYADQVLLNQDFSSPLIETNSS